MGDQMRLSIVTLFVALTSMYSLPAFADGDCPGKDEPVKDFKGTSNEVSREVARLQAYADAGTDDFSKYYAVVLSGDSFVICGKAK
jgi:hypothetical protein